VGRLEVNSILAENLHSEFSELQLAWQGQLSERVTAIAGAPDGRGWAASSAAGEVIWNSGLGEIVVLLDSSNNPSPTENRRQTPNQQTIDRIAFSPDRLWLAAGGQAGQLSIWNCERVDLPPQLVSQVNFPKWIEHLVWHPTHPAELTISYGSQVTSWDVRTSVKIDTWQFDKSAICDLAWHPEGADLAAAGSKGVRMWTPTQKRVPTHYMAVDTASLNIAWSSDGRYLAAGNLDRTLTIVDRHHPEDPWALQGCPGKIRQLAWLSSTTTPCLAVASGNAIVIWSLSSDGATWEGRLLDGHQGIVEALVAHPHAPILASGGADGYACVWSSDGQILQILTDVAVSGFTAMRWQTERTCLLAGNQVGAIGLWTIPA
jgi:WD40 repeat protein